MKKLTPFLLIITALLSIQSTCSKVQGTQSKQKKILVYSKTRGFRHSSIPAGITAIKKLGAENGFAVTATEDSTMFVMDTLKRYAAVVFLSTTGNVLNSGQESTFQNYIKSGGGFVGIHAAADCEYDWEWYGRLVGGYFKSHPKQQTAKLNVINKSHISTSHLPDVWERWDEWYNYKNLNPAVTVLIKLDEKSYMGGENGDNHPIAWYHNFEGGRAFYTGLGHTDQSFTEANFLKHILGGIQYAMGR